MQHRRAIRALDRYLTYFGAITVGNVPSDVLMSMFEEILEQTEQAAADGQPVCAVVGEDPVRFGETLLRSHVDAPWRDGEPNRPVSAIERRVHNDIERGIARERQRLVAAISRAEVVGRRTRS